MQFDPNQRSEMPRNISQDWSSDHFHEPHVGEWLKSLRFQIPFVLGVCLLISITTFGIFSSYNQANQAQDDLKIEVTTLAKNLGEGFSTYLLSNQITEIEKQILQGATNLHVDSISVFDAEGLTVSYIQRSPEGEMKVLYMNSPHKLLRGSAPQFILGTEIATVWHPIKSGKILGWIMIEANLDSIKMISKKIWYLVFSFSGISFLISLAGLYFLLMPSLRAFKRLSSFALELNTNRGTVHPVNLGSIELNHLATILNNLSVNLASQENALNKNLAVRKLAEEALQESEKISRIQFNSNPIPLFLWEKSGDDFVQLDHNTAASVRVDNMLNKNRYTKAKELFSIWPEGLRLMEQCISQQRSQFHSSARPNLRTREMKWSETTFVFIPPNRVMLHVQDITERKRAEEQIKASLTEKEVLLREIHHRVKNNLQVISSLLSLQARAETDEHTHQALENSQRRVRVMARIHENLHQSDDLASINARDFINNVVKDTIESSGHDGQSISSHIDVDDIDISMDQAIPCGQIVSELLSNSLKHAFPNGKSGNIEISLQRRDGDRIELTVADDGKGLPEDFDFDFEQTQTLGMQLVHALSNQLSGELKIDGATGTRIQIAFPEQPI